MRQRRRTDGQGESYREGERETESKVKARERGDRHTQIKTNMIEGKKSRKDRERQRDRE